MKLKSIHISGFKSFADRTTIHYHNGITGVIGPNGSGKSNIVDAVRWVMGEQASKNLRADDPTDIIFAGSQSRKPQGLAEVTLVFHNDTPHNLPEFSHLNEISIGRRINRSGEREYFLNREPCRLRDIIDFLLSIGLGAKSHAIIQQDKRDRIIQASPEGLREILEETAGISVFKVRRKEAHKRLESSQQRLTGLAEIETELSRQKETLEAQVAAAQLKRDYSQKLRDLEINLLSQHVGFYRSLLQNIQKEMSYHKDDLEKSSTNATDLEIRATDLKTEQLNLIQKIKIAENSLDDARISFTKYEERHENNKQKLRECEHLKKSLAQDILAEKDLLRREEERKNEFLDLLEKAETDLRILDGELESLCASSDEMNEALRVENFRSEELRLEMRGIESAMITLRAKNEELLNQIEKLVQSISNIEETERKDQQSCRQQAADRADLVKNLNEISSGMEEKLQEKIKVEQNLALATKDYDAFLSQRDTVKNQLMEVMSHLSSLKKLTESNEGLSDGSVLLKEKLSPLFSGFIFEKCTLHRDDENIVEQTLPHLFQAALLQNQGQFIDIVDKMEEFNATRVDFYLLDATLDLTPEEINLKNLLSHNPSIRNVGDRLEKCEVPQVKNILSRIFICKDEWALFEAKKKFSHHTTFIFITERGGAYFDPLRFSYGCSPDQSQGFLQRQREKHHYETRQQEIQEKLANMEAVLLSHQDKKLQNEERLALILSGMEKERMEAVKLGTSIESLDSQLKLIQETQSKQTAQKVALQQELNNLRATYSSQSEQNVRLEKEKQDLQTKITAHDEEVLSQKSLLEDLLPRIQSKKSDRAVLQERRGNYRHNYEETTYQHDRIFQKLTDLFQRTEKAEEQAGVLSQTIDAELSEVTSTHQRIQEFTDQLNSLLAAEAEISETLQVIESKIKGQKELFVTKQKFITEKQLESARAEAILDTALKEAYDKFALPPEGLLQSSSDTPEQRTAAEKEIKKIQAAITDLGPVNEAALEEFTNVTDRISFLSTQKEDIQKSMHELTTSIESIEESTKTRFQEIFNQVNSEFQKIFPILFPGGIGKLNMLDPADLLSTGVEILVQLPGKRMQNMALFSGGEKALTGISLILSLLKTTPAPFCFLDEVDAPLDEANVGRFNAILEALSSEFQFIVITHNRRTMEVLDTIYGISMSEPGVSKLVSVDLSAVPSHLRRKTKENQQLTEHPSL